tara:strand:- start:483 stop:725 length:243 start_codon:yes stop_codon:yes gene_type:complete
MKKTLFIIGLGAIVACSNPSGENKETSTVVEKFYGEKIDNNNLVSKTIKSQVVSVEGVWHADTQFSMLLLFHYFRTNIFS